MARLKNTRQPAPVYFVDLFAGAGGLSEGLTMANMRPIAHVEADESASMTLRTRAAYRSMHETGNLSAYRAYLTGRLDREQLYARTSAIDASTVINETLSPKTEKEIFRRIDRQLELSGAVELDVLAGGPPCQPFSIVGRHAFGKKGRDGRLWLFKHYVNALREYRPKCFLFENVPGLLSAGDGHFLREILASLNDSGYDCKWSVVDASQYGVLQQRKRLIILGRRNDLLPLLDFPEQVLTNAKVANLLNDLPPVAPGEDASATGYRRTASPYLVSSGLRNNWNILTQHAARPQNARDREIYRRVASLWAESGRRLHCRDLPKKLRPQRSCDCFRDRFKVVAPDLAFSHTVIAHIANDGHYYIHPDINQARSLTVREAARLQTFPDNYYFEGGRRASFKQIGNAVPPILAKAFGFVLRQFVEQTRTIELRISA